jgi:hypothetical protein
LQHKKPPLIDGFLLPDGDSDTALRRAYLAQGGGGGLDAKNKDGESPVIHAVKKGDVCMAEQLVSMQG